MSRIISIVCNCFKYVRLEVSKALIMGNNVSRNVTPPSSEWKSRLSVIKIGMDTRRGMASIEAWSKPVTVNGIQGPC
jgi:hypothetical protein